MKKHLNRIKKIKDAPDSLKELASDLDTYEAMDAVALSEGGQILIENLIVDIVSIIDTLCLKYKTESHIAMISQCADMKSKIDIVRAITRAGKQKKDLREMLDEQLKS